MPTTRTIARRLQINAVDVGNGNSSTSKDDILQEISDQMENINTKTVILLIRNGDIMAEDEWRLHIGGEA